MNNLKENPHSIQKNNDCVSPTDTKNAAGKAVLISVFDKTGIGECAREFHSMGYTILSTGGSYRELVIYGIPVISIEQYTGGQEMFDGRVKTLHPAIYAGILARRDEANDMQALAKEQFLSIDAVLVNLYPFETMLHTRGASHETLIENIDIGGVTLLRAAAKNHEHVAVVSDPDDYSSLMAIMKEKQEVRRNSGTAARVSAMAATYNKLWAAKAFAHTAHYDALIASYMEQYAVASCAKIALKRKQSTSAQPGKTAAMLAVQWNEYTLPMKKTQTLRYGENPHQNADVYKLSTASGKKSVIDARQLHGKQMSFNNIRDTEAAARIACEFEKPCVVAVKHANPCGVGVASTLPTAWEKCYASDTTSIFGGIVASNRAIGETLAKKLQSIFLEIIIAPSFTEGAKQILKMKKNLRLLTLPINPRAVSAGSSASGHMVSVFGGGMLKQDYDTARIQAAQCECVSSKKPTKAQVDDLLFAWTVCKYVKSNAIVIAKNGATLGIGAGQMNRVGAAGIAINHIRAKNNANKTKLAGAVMASDAFFPMPDTVQLAVKYGISAIIQPGGSIRDKDSIAVCDAKNIVMLCTKVRHFLH